MGLLNILMITIYDAVE